MKRWLIYLAAGMISSFLAYQVARQAQEFAVLAYIAVLVICFLVVDSIIKELTAR